MKVRYSYNILFFGVPVNSNICVSYQTTGARAIKTRLTVPWRSNRRVLPPCVTPTTARHQWVTQTRSSGVSSQQNNLLLKAPHLFSTAKSINNVWIKDQGRAVVGTVASQWEGWNPGGVLELVYFKRNKKIKEDKQRRVISIHRNTSNFIWYTCNSKCLRSKSSFQFKKQKDFETKIYKCGWFIMAWLENKY